jgi:hypothetical protein
MNAAADAGIVQSVSGYIAGFQHVHEQVIASGLLPR